MLASRSRLMLSLVGLLLSCGAINAQDPEVPEPKEPQAQAQEGPATPEIPKQPDDYVQLKEGKVSIHFLTRFEKKGEHGEALTGAQAQKNVKAMLKNVASVFGEIQAKLHFVPTGKGVPAFPIELERGVVVIQYTVDAMREVPTLAHQLAHYRAHEAGLRLPRMLEENLAMVAERGTKVPHPIYQELKKRGGPLRIEKGQLLDTPPVKPKSPEDRNKTEELMAYGLALGSYQIQMRDWQQRYQGTMWLLAHHLANKHSAEEIQMLKPEQYPSSKEAWETLNKNAKTD